MNRDYIIRIAKEAGFKASVGKTDKEGNYHPYVNALSKDVPVEWLERFAAMVAAAEREACAQVVDASQPLGRIAETSAAIRARGNETGKAKP